MTKAFLKFPQRPMNYAPKIISRRMGLTGTFRGNAPAYKSDGGDGGDDSDGGDGNAESKALLKMPTRSGLTNS